VCSMCQLVTRSYIVWIYSSEARMVGVLCAVCCVVCGLIALAGSSPWITESWCVDAGAGGFILRLGSCTILFDDVTYSLCTCVVCVYRRIESRYVKVSTNIR